MITNDILKNGEINVLEENNELKVYEIIEAQGDSVENRDSAGHEAHDGGGIGHEAHDGSGIGHEAGDPGHFSTFEKEKDIYSLNQKNQELSLKKMVEIRKKNL